MSDTKRILLTTIADGKKPPAAALPGGTAPAPVPAPLTTTTTSSTSSTAAAASSSSTAAAAAAAAATVATASSTTIRLDLNLFEPNADSFPEFNYSKLLHVEKKKKKKLVKVNGFTDPFEDNNEDVARIAKELEKKYGNAYSSSKFRSNNDYCDKGAGYDENDEFIDNTEAYDEIIPDEIETDRGGFYINSGALQFKQLPNFERPDDALRMPKPKKRQLSTTSESSASEEESDKRANTAIRNGHIDKKPKNIDNKIKDKAAKIDKVRVTVKDKKEDGAGSDSGKDNGVKKQVKTTTVKDMLRAKRDSMRNMVESGGHTSGTKSDESDDSENESSSSDDSDASDDEDGKRDGSNINGKAEGKLPENLPADLLGYINKITEASKTSNAGKHNFFDSANMDLLYKIDSTARSKGLNVRNQIYNYLEIHLPCTKQTILMRAKKMRIQKEENKTTKCVNKLKAAVDAVMPDVVQSYENECKRIQELRTTASLSQTNGGSEKPEQIYKMPRKRFTWTDALRDYLCDLVNTRKQSFNIIKPRKETVEEFLNRYLKESVLKIWPEGWMKIEELHKEYEKRKSTLNKYPKENKKPTESTGTSGSTQKDPISLVSVPNNNNNVVTSKAASITQSNAVKEKKSILSSNNPVSLSITSTESKTTSSNSSSNGKKNSSTESVPALNSVVPSTSSATLSVTSIPTTVVSSSMSLPSTTPTFGSSLTITPVGANDVTSKPLPSVQNKVTITNVESTIRTIQSNSTSIDYSTKTTVSTAVNVSNKPINLTTSTATTVTSTSTLSTSDYVSPPPKRSTDHSINSIISSSATLNPNPLKCDSGTTIDLVSPTKLESPTTTLPPTVSASASATTGTTTTHVINLDNLKTKNDILNTAAAQSKASSNATTAPSECNIRVRSVETVNRTLDTNATAMQISPSANNSKSSSTLPSTPNLPASLTIIPEDIIEEIDSSSSDDVEFIGVSVNSNVKRQKKPGPRSKTAPYMRKTKYKKDSSNSSGSSSPKIPHMLSSMTGSTGTGTTQKSNKSKDEFKRKDAGLSTMENKDGDFDVNQIMKELKELQELQATSIHSSDNSSSHHKGNLHHSTSLPYKKFDHSEHTSQLSRSSS